MDTHEHPSRAEVPAAEGLDESMLTADPVDQFSAWLADAVAAGLPEPNAMVLATATPAGAPSARVVLDRIDAPLMARGSTRSSTSLTLA